MISFLEYVFGEVKDRRLPKPDAIELLRQFQRPRSQPAPPLHPLLGTNTSDLEGPRFSTALTGGEFFLADHRVNGRSVLPGVALLEMARAAVERVTGAAPTAVRLRNAVFARPLAVGGGATGAVTAHVALSAEEDGEIAFEIYTEGEAGDVVHASGHALLVEAADEPPRVDLAALQARCTTEQSGAQCYETFRWLGMQYGPAHRGLGSVAGGIDANGSPFVLATIAMPAVVASTRGEYGLHPSMLDAALQAVVGWKEESESGAGRPSLPFSVAQVDLFFACPVSGYAYLRQTEAAQGALRKLDVYLCDEEGRVSVRLQGLTLRRLETEAKPEATATLLFQPQWKEQLAEGEGDLRGARQLVVLCGQPAEIVSAEGRARIESELPGALVVMLETEGTTDVRAMGAIAAFFELLRERMQETARGELLLQIIVPAASDEVAFAGISGLLETARLENPKLVPQLIAVEPGGVDALVAILRENRGAGAQRQLRYEQGRRQVASWVELQSESAEIANPFVDGGVYLISGGAGGLGLLFAREIASRTNGSTILLTGRSPLSAEKEQALDALRAGGARIDYRQIDVTDRAAVEALIATIEAEQGRVDGVIHSAGIVRDAFLIHKSAADVRDVLAPKIAGAVHLDEATAHLPLSFFVLCSSLAGATGNIGQADYAAANAFLDAYAAHRQQLAAAGRRQGQSLSLNWPLWAEGGMQVDPATAARMRANIGVVPLATAAGMDALARALASGRPQLMVLPGDPERIRQLLRQRPAARPAVPAPVATELNAEALQARAVLYLKKLLAPTLGLPVDRIEAETPLETYGIDSIRAMQLTAELEKSFGSLSKTLFFEYLNIETLAAYFVDQHRQRLTALVSPAPAQVHSPHPAFGRDLPEGEGRGSEAPLPLGEGGRRPGEGGPRRRRFGSVAREKTQQPVREESRDIAVIGISGRYPQAENLAAFWENLKHGRDCITEIPKERWDSSLWFDAEKGKLGKSYSKWGGFLDGADRFDPLFFNISPREAEGMDPQERLFLQCVYETLEDAGYTRESLARHRSSGLEGNVGVFVGVMYEEYQLLGAQAQALGKPFALSGNPSLIANRVSYFCNFHGPSIALDTMCSSSLTALHLACQSLQRGGCEVAVAGGVNLSLHPNKYLALSQGQFASSQGRCESFGEGGDGYVPGEGVGAVLLKPLAKAIADGDQIYGVIKATAINHGGKTNGFSVPNPHAQANVISQALASAGIPARAVSYIEAHGTGTKLGDPIEIAGLARAFSESTADRQFCAIGSAKSNIGHCESAAGIAGLTKVLLQMKHRQLAPSLHAETLNPHIDFANSAFTVQRELGEWKRPTLTVDGQAREYPRIAGLSSFGAGGSNAHVVIEEYVDARPAATLAIGEGSPAIVVLSAKTEEQLRQQAANLVAAIETSGGSDADLADLAYTLQVGREAMEQRLALTAASMDQLREKLGRWLAGEQGIEELYRGEVKRNKEALSLFTAALFTGDAELQEAIGKWIARGKVAKVLDLWVKGLPFDWTRLHRDERPRRISLPTYPFARERYWVPVPELRPIATVASTTPTVLHPLLHANTSSLAEQRFTSTFSGREFFLADHTVQGARVLPGVAYLEMARAAVTQALELSGEDNGIALGNIVWSQPFAVGERPASLHVALLPEESGEIGYEIYSDGAGGEETLHSQGVAHLVPATEGPSIDLGSLRARVADERFTAVQLYAVYKALGIDYGPAHRGVESLAAGTDGRGQRFVLAEVRVPHGIAAAAGEYLLHPTVLDSALHASLGLSLAGILDGSASGGATWVPFALEGLQLFGRCPQQVTAVIRESVANSGGLRKLDVDLCDATGKVYVQLRGFTARALVAGETQTAAEPVLTFVETWEEQPLPKAPARAHVILSRGARRNASVKMLRTPRRREPFPSPRRARPRSTSVFGERVRVRGNERLGSGLSRRSRFLSPPRSSPLRIPVDSLPLTLALSPKTSPKTGMGGSGERETVPGRRKTSRQSQFTRSRVIRSREEREDDPAAPKSIVAILDDAERRDAFTAAMRTASPATLVRFVAPDAAALTAMAGEHGTPDALVDLRSLGHPGALRQPLQIAALVGALMTSGVQWPRLIVAGEYADGLERCYVDSWLGFARSLRNVLPQTRVTVVGCSTSDTAIGDWAARLVAELGTVKPESVLYERGRRLVSSVHPAERTDAATLLRRGATYVITGGTGGLGLLVAGHLAEHYAANLLLTGRSALDEAKAAKLRGLEAFGARVLYRQADVCDRDAMRVALTDAEQQFGSVDGVIHAAGVESHGADPAAFRAVLAPKVDGTLALEEALGARPLDFVCYFSSSSAVLGDFGTCDYAIGNRFQSAFAAYRGQQPAARRMVAISWPLWRDGGMGAADDASTRAYLQASGQRALETAEGLALFEQLLAAGSSQPLVMAGQPGRIHRLLGVTSETAQVPSAVTEPTPVMAGELERRTRLFLGKLLSSTLKVPLERIESDAPLEAYGIDSVMVMQLTAELEKSLGSLPKTLFFEHQTLDALAAHLVTSHHAQLVALLGLEASEPVHRPHPPSGSRGPSPLPLGEGGRRPGEGTRRRARFAPSGSKPAAQPATRRFEEIAVIGVSGRYPQAANLTAFWENLKAGKDCITEIPKDRWDLTRYFDAEKGKRGKSYSKWGGFIDGVDQFDPLFFNVSPREAEGMDPQERLFLQCVYETLEDAGYTREALARHSELGLDGNVGVFVGVMYEEYQLFGAQAQALGHPFALPGNPATIANRVSYFCNFHGPSMAVDTMCSSSLTAIHLACQSLQRGGCEVAIAGGVNVSIHPNKYLALSQGQFLSSQGRCESFGEGGDGFVAGEGVGAVLLKPLAKAVADRDQIYGVIRATAVNHGGKTNGYSVPNPAAQANVIANALRESGIPARAISYIEAHGTGTKLGDPIEIAGLSKAFAQSTSDTQFCAIGSAKSNIGHCESAAGIAGVTKVLLQMKHQTLAPSLHAQTLNPHIDFLRSPFVVQQELAEWKRPTFDLDGRTQTFPRIAGISSFGAGGSNAHVVIEEYVAPVPEVPVAVTAQSPALVVLSARGEEQLVQQVRNLLAAIEERHLDDSHLADVAYTLQLGREPMEQRLALAARSMADLRGKLTRFLAGEEGIDDLHRGEGRGNRGLLAAFTTDDDLQLAVRSWVEKGKHAKLLDLWVRGLSFDWRTLHAAAEPRRISLPTYPFAKERYWAVPSSDALLGATLAAGTPAATLLHPLLHENTSDLYEQRFTSTFNGKEFFLADHKVQGARVLPGVCYLEMARAAVTRASGVSGTPPMTLRNIVWSRPFTVDASPAALHIALVPEESGRVAYEIYSDTDTDAVVHSQGVAELLASVEGASIDLDALRARSGAPLLADQVYAVHAALGIDYGPAHRGVQSIATGTGADGRRFALAQVTLPPSIAESRHRYLLHPTLLDSALHASIGLMLGDASAPGQPVTWLPFALEQLTILAPMPDSLQVVLRESAGNSSKLRKLDVDLCDAAGNVCVQLRGFTARALEASAPAAATTAVPARTIVAEESAVLTFTEEWEEAALTRPSATLSQGERAPANAQQGEDQTLLPLGEGARRADEGGEAKTILCILRGEEYRRGAVEALRRIDPTAKAIFTTITIGDVATLGADLKAIARQHGRPDAILYLAAVEEREAVRDYDSIVTLIQGVAAADLKCPRIVLAAEFATDVERCYADSWLGFPRSLRLTLPETRVSVIAVAHGGKGKAKPGAVMYQWMNRLWAELGNPKAESALYESGKRFVPRMQPTERSASASGFRRGGTYLLTGALGSLGSLIATHLADRYDANLILTGRRPLGDDEAARLAPLGDRALVLQADVCDLASMQRAVQQGRERFGSITGVIHAAGVESGQSILIKNLTAFQRVLAPKVEGTLVLDEALKGEAIELVCYLSSSAAILGDFSYCDYAVANRFQMAFARYHKPKTINGKVGAKLVAINWPLWKEGHMMVGGEESTRLYLQTTGQRALETAEALELLDQLTAEAPAQQLVMAGTPSRIHRLLGMAPELVIDKAPVTVALPAIAVPSMAQALLSASPASAGSLEAKTIHYLKQLLSASIKLPLQRIDAEAAFESYGVESVMAMQLTAEMEKALGSLPKTLFFEYLTVEALAHHLAGNYREPLVRLLGADAAAAPTARAAAAVPPALPAVAAVSTEGAATRSRGRKRFAGASTNVVQDSAQNAGSRDIAIIGISGRYPMARNLDAFWANLVAGVDSVTEVPAERWDHSAYFDARKGRGGKSYSKWGGFLEEIDRFDPLFFNISPREAQFMDPQERLFLESVWNLLESSGCTREMLQQRYESKVGVYVGSMYQQLGSLASRSAVANRVSYFFGLQGPSMAIDTMCSSAAVAIHNACGDLLRGDCRLAIAGGINLTTHPVKYVSLSQGQLLGSHPGSRSFADGDGYIPAEAVGSVLLKPLAQAEADGDEILAVIKASAVNHSGRSNGYSVPNPAAQAQLIEETIRKAGVDVRTISYVEAAANGSALGDPIELAALGRVFGPPESGRPLCAIGSVKSNMGHAEAASGIAQLTKVVLQLRQRQLVPSIGAETLNPNLTFDGTNFHLQREGAAWTRTVVTTGGEAREVPRRALLNSFGAGGSNACLVVEEYVRAAVPAPATDRPEVIVLSAKNPGRLAALVADLLDHVSAREELSLADLAYTLQMGREAMSSRLALVAGNRRELLEALRAYVDDFENGSGIALTTPFFTGELTERSPIQMLTTGKAGEAMMQVLLDEQSVEKLALLWTQGCRIDWARLHAGEARRVIPLPTYPFERDLLPLPAIENAPRANAAALHEVVPIKSAPAAVPALHVLRTANKVAPRNDLERSIAAAWEEALGISGLGVDDSFLDLGGNSIQGAHIVSRVRELFAIDIPIQALLGPNPTIANMAIAVVTELVRLEGEGAFDQELVESPA